MNYIESDRYWMASNPQPGMQIKIHWGAIDYTGIRTHWTEWLTVSKPMDKDGDFSVYSRCHYWFFTTEDIKDIRTQLNSQ